MFCRNCGSQLTEGAKFCSECGTKVEDVQVREFDNLEIEEPAAVTDTFASASIGADEAFNSRVSFDWSNVIDEPQKKEIPQGIKSPWASTTGSIDERMIYSEMDPSDDKNRTMSFIDVLKADKEEREKAALDRSIEYTEVLEIDPEIVGGNKPPTLHAAPLYEDVDEPVITPFDDAVTEEAEQATSEAETTRTSASKFELPDFLKKAAGFGAGKVEEEQEEEHKEEHLDEFAETADAVDDAAAADTVADSESAETAEDVYLDEDIYLDLEERPSDEARMSRVDTHTLAGDYDFFDDEEDGQSEESYEETTMEQIEESHDDETIAEQIVGALDDETIDEEALFAEIGSKEVPETGKTGMTIAAPADEEAEIEALKRRLAELTGTVEIDPALLEEAEASDEAESAFEAFTFEPEVTEADDALFAGLTAASESESEGESEESIEDIYLSDEFAFEPEVTEKDDALFAGLTAASETANEVSIDEPSFGLSDEDELIVEEFSAAEQEADPDIGQETAFETEPETEAEPELSLEADAEQEQEPATQEIIETEPEPAEEYKQPAPMPVETEEQEETAAEEKSEPTVEELLAKYVPQYFGPQAGATAEEPIAAAEPDEIAEPEQPVPFGLADFEAKEQASDLDALAKDIEETKPTDAVSLEDLEKDLFGSVADEETEAETTKKIDKFYTLYRKNEEFQRLLDEEYSRLKGEHIEIPEDELPVAGIVSDKTEAASEIVSKTATDAVDDAAPDVATSAPGFGLGASIEEATTAELAADTKPVEDATIYQMEMPEELAELARKSQEDNSGFSVGGEDAKSYGLSGDEVAGAAALGAAAVAGAAATSKADKKAEKKAAKQAEKQKRKEASAASEPQVEYENVDAGSTILTVLAVIVAILLVILLAIILILHIAPNSEIALTIDSIIGRITGHFSTSDIFDFNKWI